MMEIAHSEANLFEIAIDLGSGDFAGGFAPVTVAIRRLGNGIKESPAEMGFQLPPFPEMPTIYKNWQKEYRGIVAPDAPRGFKTGQKTQVSSSEELAQKIANCDRTAHDLREGLNQWLEPIKEGLESTLRSNTPKRIRCEIQTQGITADSVKDILHRLPWKEWDLFPENAKVEVVLSLAEASPEIRPVEPDSEPKRLKRVRILGILGKIEDKERGKIDLRADEQLVRQSPGVEPHFLLEPERSDFAKLWDESWDILFYGGHSHTEDNGQTGLLKLSDEPLNIQEIRRTLQTAIERGLKLAIFNSCDGLGLARQLGDLDLPYIIVWKEPVPDKIAQAFLRYFLKAFAGGESLEGAVEYAQSRLKELGDLEKDLPGVTQLPVVVRNSASAPLTWFQLGGIAPCPYRGLFAFQEEDAPYFFGRDRFAETLLEAVRRQPLVAVVGASGSGKSSVVLAGLIPRLRRDVTVGWLVAVFRPGNNPIEALARVLAPFGLPERENRRLVELELEGELRGEGGLCRVIERIVAPTADSPLTRLVLVADQFEELYTNSPEEERQPFVDSLLAAVKSAPAFTLVLTLRGDFYGFAISYPPLSDALQGNTFNLSTMYRDELRDAIVRPAQKMQVQLEAGLTDALMDDLGDRAGRLPLLEFALTRLWERQQDWTLTHQAYEEIGGLERALADYAEGVYAQLSEAERERAKRVFIQLVRLGEGTEATRRLAAREQVKEENWDLVKRLADARLVVTNRNESTGEETVEVVHEALIRRWGRLGQWLRDNEDFLRWQYRLEDALRQWESHESQEGYLLREAPLVEAEGWLQRRREELSNPQNVFIQLGLGLRDREIKRDKERKQREIRQARRIALGSLIATGLLAGLSAIAGLQLRKAEAEQIRTALALNSAYLSSNQELEAQIESIRAGKTLQQSLWQKIFPDPDLKTQVQQEMQNTLSKAREVNRLFGEKVAFSPDRTRLATTSVGGIFYLWNFDGDKLAEYKLDREESSIKIIAFSPDSTKIATLDSNFRDNDNKQVDIVYLWDLEGKLLAKFQPFSYPKSEFSFYSANKSTEELIFSPDAEKIATLGKEDDNKIILRLWNLEGKRLDEFEIVLPGLDYVKVASSSDRKKLAVGTSNIVHFLDWKSGQMTKFKAMFSGTLQAIAFTPDRTRLITAELDRNVNSNIVRIWTLEGKQITQFKTNYTVSKIAFSSSEKELYIISENDDNIFSVWDLEGKQLGQYSGVQSIDFTLDNKQRAFAFVDGTVRVQSLDSSEAQFKVKSDRIPEIKFSSDGRQLVTVVSNNIHFWSLQNEKYSKNNFIKKKEFPTQQNEIRAIFFNPQGTRIVTNSDEGEISFWSIEGKKIAELNTQKIVARKMLLSPNETQLAILGNNGSIYLWNLENNQLMELQKQGRLEDMNFSPNGTQLVTSGADGTVRFWDLKGKQLTNFKAHHGSAWSVIFSPDGTKIATRGSDNFARIWSIEGNQLAQIKAHSISGDVSAISSMTFSPNGKAIATYGYDYFVRLWDLKGNQLDEQNLGYYADNITFSPDSTQLIISSSSQDKSVIWDPISNRFTEFKGDVGGKFIFSNTLPILVSINPMDTYIWDLNGNQLGKLQGSSSAFNPNSNLIATAGSNGLVEIWQIREVDTLLSKSCKRIQNYLKNNPTVAAKDRTLCDHI